MNQDSPPPPPAAPDYSKLYSQGIQANVDSLPEQREIENAARMGTKVTYTDSTGKQRTADFTGMGDADASVAAARASGQVADVNAQSALGLAQKYGEGFVNTQKDLTRLSDPTRYDAMQDYGKTVASDFDLGAQLDDATRREVEQSARGGQAARGNILGNASAFDEAMQIGSAATQRKLQRQGAMQSYLGLAPTSSQFQNTNLVPDNGTLSPLSGLNPNAGQSGVNFGQGLYGQQANIWNTQTQYAATQPNYLATGLGVAGGLASTLIPSLI